MCVCVCVCVCVSVRVCVCAHLGVCCFLGVCLLLSVCFSNCLAVCLSCTFLQHTHKQTLRGILHNASSTSQNPTLFLSPDALDCL